MEKKEEHDEIIPHLGYELERLLDYVNRLHIRRARNETVDLNRRAMR